MVASFDSRRLRHGLLPRRAPRVQRLASPRWRSSCAAPRCGTGPTTGVPEPFVTGLLASTTTFVIAFVVALARPVLGSWVLRHPVRRPAGPAGDPPRAGRPGAARGAGDRRGLTGWTGPSALALPGGTGRGCVSSSPVRAGPSRGPTAGRAPRTPVLPAALRPSRPAHGGPRTMSEPVTTEQRSLAHWAEDGPGRDGGLLRARDRGLPPDGRRPRLGGRPARPRRRGPRPGARRGVRQREVPRRADPPGSRRGRRRAPASRSTCSTPRRSRSPRRARCSRSRSRCAPSTRSASRTCRPASAGSTSPGPPTRSTPCRPPRSVPGSPAWSPRCAPAASARSSTPRPRRTTCASPRPSAPRSPPTRCPSPAPGRSGRPSRPPG